MRCLSLVFLSAVAILAEEGGSSALTPQAPEDDRLLVRQFAVEQERALAKLGSYSVTFDESWHGDLVKDVVAIEARYVLKNSGFERWFHVDERETMQDRRGDLTVRDNSEWLVVNHGYVFYWHERSPVAYMWEFDSPETIPQIATTHIGKFETRAVYKHGFGTGFGKLLDAVDPSRGVQRIVVEETQPKVFKVRASYSAVENLVPEFEWTIDGTKGYLITEVIARDPQLGYTEPYGRVAVSVSEIAPGIWFPMRWQHFTYGEPEPTGRRQVEKQSENVVTSVKVNERFGADQFTWKSVPIRLGVEVWRTDVSGELVKMRPQGGELVSQTALDHGK
jgi:hypothetical protein